MHLLHSYYIYFCFLLLRLPRQKTSSFVRYSLSKVKLAISLYVRTRRLLLFIAAFFGGEKWLHHRIKNLLDLVGKVLVEGGCVFARKIGNLSENANGALCEKSSVLFCRKQEDTNAWYFCTQVLPSRSCLAQVWPCGWYLERWEGINQKDKEKVENKGKNK